MDRKNRGMPKIETTTISIPELNAIRGELSSHEGKTIWGLSDPSFDPVGIIVHYNRLPSYLADKLRTILTAARNGGLAMFEREIIGRLRATDGSEECTLSCKHTVIRVIPNPADKSMYCAQCVNDYVDRHRNSAHKEHKGQGV